MKRLHDSKTIENPFVKPENQSWQVATSLTRAVSPPPISKRSAAQETITSTAAVEAGEVEVRDHVAFFSERLLAATRPARIGVPRIQHEAWLDLYKRNLHPGGHHFVVHQHDHPVAGLHYDLRLQCNETSSISFAIMYGLPGDPNSRRLRRHATETRVHNLWNHLIETASHSTGPMLLWDTGEFTVLPYREPTSQTASDGEEYESVDAYIGEFKSLSEPERLRRSFQAGQIRIQLHGTRLPPSYTLSIRLGEQNDNAEQPRKPIRKRRKLDPKRQARRTPDSSDSESDSIAMSTDKRKIASLIRTASPPPKSEQGGDPARSEDEDGVIRQSNAYTGATNSIGSIHQRKWFLSMDRQKSGFMSTNLKMFGSRVWTRRQREDGALEGFEKFHVLGREVERSVVTGRLASEILADEDVKGYVPRGSWKPVTE